MRFELATSAYDVMDQVHVTVVLRETQDGAGQSSHWTRLVSTTLEGTGETDPREWARDALVAALEAL